MMKKYFTVLSVFAAVAFTNAQSTIFSSDFSEASYDDSGAQANLNAHADWVSGHNTSATSVWKANTNEQIECGSNFSYAVLNTPIKAIENDVITITSVMMLGYNNQNFKDATLDMVLVGLTPSIPTPLNAASAGVLGSQRDGVTIGENNNATTGNTADDLIVVKSAGGTAFVTNPTLSQANKSAYEVIMEFTIGNSAATSTKK